MSRTLIVIPARLKSERLPNKLLLTHKSKTLLEWTYRAAEQCNQLADVTVATADAEIFRTVAGFGGLCVMQQTDFSSGTARSFSVFRDTFGNRYDRLLVWQADEPYITKNHIEKILNEPTQNPITTIVTPFDTESVNDTNNVKAVFQYRRCLWFTREPLRHTMHHRGLYLFDNPSVVDTLSILPPSSVAKEESLEQLTWLAHGYPIGGVVVPEMRPSINTRSDWELFTYLL